MGEESLLERVTATERQPRSFTTASVLATRAITPPFASPTNGSASFMRAGNHEPTQQISLSPISEKPPRSNRQCCDKRSLRASTFRLIRTLRGSSSYPRLRRPERIMCLAALTPCDDAGFRLRNARACVRQDQADILRFDRFRFFTDRWPGAAQRPQWLSFWQSLWFDSRSQNMMELLKFRASP